MSTSVVIISPPSSQFLFSIQTSHCVGGIACAQLGILSFPAALEGPSSSLRSLRVNLFTYTHRRTYTHIWCEVWKSVPVLYYHFVTFTRFTDLRFSAERNIFIFSLKNVDSCVCKPAPKVRSAAVGEKRLITGDKGRWFCVGHWNITGSCETKRILLLWASGGFAMTSRRNSAKLKLRRSFSEQLRNSTSKAWDLLWKNVRERRLAGQ